MKQLFLMCLLRIIPVVIPICLGGCGPSLDYNPETREIHYRGSMFGKQIKRLSVLREKDGSVLLEMEDYQTENVSQIVEGAVSGAVNALK